MESSAIDVLAFLDTGGMFAFAAIVYWELRTMRGLLDRTLAAMIDKIPG
jgi:hypothetical protein